MANSSELFKSENDISMETFESLQNSYNKLIEAGVIGENLSEFDDLSSFMSAMSGIDSTTGNAILAADNGVISGEMINDDDIQIEGRIVKFLIK